MSKANKKIKVSILLTCYNFENYIEAAVNSLLGQHFEEAYEIIITDDGSADNSAKILSTFAKNNKVKLIVNEKNLGVAVSLNNAFSLATGQYLCRFDGDDQWEPNFLKELCQVLDQNSDVAMAYSDCSYFDENNMVTNANVKTKRTTSLLKTREFKAILSNYYITAPTLMFRKIALNGVFPLPTHLKFLDWYISLCVSKEHYSYYLEKCLAKYRIHSGGMHITMVRDLYGEQTTKMILAKFLTNDEFTTNEKKNIIFYHSKSFVIRYFANGMFMDVRRVTLETIKSAGLISVFKDKLIRRYFSASFLGHRYKSLKKSLW